MAEPDAVPQKSRAGRIAGPKKCPHPLTLDAIMLFIDFVRAHGCKSVKRGCETSACGLCTVMLDDVPALSCSTLAARADGRSVYTLEGLQAEASEFVGFIADQGAEQCGFCGLHPFAHGETGRAAGGVSDLVCLADYVLVEADGAKRLPLKAHAEHESVIPACAGRTVCMVGVDGLGAPVSQTCHRPQRFAQLAGVSVDDAVTPEAVAAVLCAEGLHDVVLINKVETAADWQAARRIAALCDTPVAAGSLWRDDLRCLR